MSDEEEDKIENSMKRSKENNFDTHGEDSIEAFENSTPPSDLVDTQPDEWKNDDEPDDDDDEDDVPLSALKYKPRSLKNQVVSALESSDEENEFTWDSKVQPSQTTRAIKSQLLKFENSFDVKTLEKRLKEAQEAKAIISSNKKMKFVSDENTKLKKANKQLSLEKETLRKELEAANAKIKEKNDLLAQLTAKLDSYQPILEAVKNLGFAPKMSPKTPQRKSRKRSLQKKNIRKKPLKHDDGDASSEPEVDNSSMKEVLHTPTVNKPIVQKVNVISGSTKKKNQKPNNHGNMTFSVSKKAFIEDFDKNCTSMSLTLFIHHVIVIVEGIARSWMEAQKRSRAVQQGLCPTRWLSEVRIKTRYSLFRGKCVVDKSRRIGAHRWPRRI